MLPPGCDRLTFCLVVLFPGLNPAPSKGPILPLPVSALPSCVLSFFKAASESQANIPVRVSLLSAGLFPPWEGGRYSSHHRGSHSGLQTSLPPTAMLPLGKLSQGAAMGLCEHQKPGGAGAGLVCFPEQCRTLGWGPQQGKIQGEASEGWRSWQEVKKSSSEEALFQTLYI